MFLLFAFLEFCHYFIMVVFAQKSLEKESKEIRESVELSVEPDIAICQLDAVTDVGILILADQCIQGAHHHPR